MHFSEKGYFQEAFGYDCVDAGDVPGKLGTDIEAQILRLLRKSNLWPITAKYDQYSEDDIFDVIEFLYDYISKPVDGYNHIYNNCGWHYDTFDVNLGREEYRAEINELLCEYKEGYELSSVGEILELPEKGQENLLLAKFSESRKLKQA